ncbi:MAG: ankyrin repeat domain-containing protein [Deltaproteobacteria bacterium]|nr:ankyrin repeat domain-containing protein [Deltaproteobacteria bacterium]
MKRASEVDHPEDLYAAITSDLDLALFEGLLRRAKSIDIQLPERGYATPLLHSCYLERPAHAELLLAAGADVNLSDVGGVTPLMIAVSRKLESVVGSLLERRADVNATTRRGRHVLAFAIDSGSLALIQLLVANGANVFYEEPGRFTLLMHAVLAGSVDIVSHFLEAGVDPAIRTESRSGGYVEPGQTALDFSRRGGFNDIEDLIVQVHARGGMSLRER